MQTQIEDLAAGLLVALAPMGLIYAWYFCCAKLRGEPRGWRNRVTFASLALASLLLLLCPLAMILAPKGGPATWAGAPEHQEFVYARARFGLRGLLSHSWFVLGADRA